MSNQTLTMSEDLYRYVLSVSLRESDCQRRLREETAQLAEHNMQISPEQGQFMSLLVKLIGARNVLEIGTFTGYSALSMALSLSDGGKIYCCDTSREWTDIAKRYWAEAGVADKVDLHLAPALETLGEFERSGLAGKFDFVFIDADKANYKHYFEACLTLVRVGGLIMIDNTLWSGAVIDEEDQSEDTMAIRVFNQALLVDSRVTLSLLPVSDGLTLALKC